jgi:hypothetical protein
MASERLFYNRDTC